MAAKKTATRKRSRPESQTVNVEAPVEEPLRQTNEFEQTETGPGRSAFPAADAQKRINEIVKRLEAGGLSDEERRMLKVEKRDLQLGKR